MWYEALELARYVISECMRRGKPLSNLKLQKILYYVWVNYFRETGRYIFIDDICAWQLGPVIPVVYYEYCSYAGRPISNIYPTGISDQDQLLINSILDKYIDVSASTLVSWTHQSGSAWDCVYKDGEGNKKVIPFQLIISKEVG
ncbi:DUF4065 domain-containing protein [Lachnospiraceae bacterium MD335]|nr:DUF4065 domain-containing protein [Lachnospiraceae bacterium MD335]